MPGRRPPRASNATKAGQPGVHPHLRAISAGSCETNSRAFADSRLACAVVAGCEYRHRMNATFLPRFLSCCLLLTFAVLLPSATLALDFDESEQIKAVERQMGAALIKNDLATLAELLAEDWQFVGAEGEIVGRDEVLGALRSGQLKFDSYELSGMKVRMYGDTAVVIASGASKGSMAGEAFDERDVFTDVFVRRDGKWRCVSTHSTDLRK